MKAVAAVSDRQSEPREGTVEIVGPGGRRSGQGIETAGVPFRFRYVPAGDLGGDDPETK